MATAQHPIRRTTSSEKDQAKLRLPLTTGEAEVGLQEEKPRRTKRVAALDVFRGLTVAVILLSPSSSISLFPILFFFFWETYGLLASDVQLMILVDGAGGEWPVIGHAPWNGCNLADFVMPFFLFIVGMAIPLSLKV